MSKSTNAESRGSIIRSGTIWRIQNALVEEVFTQDGRTGFMLVSFEETDSENITYISLLRLNVEPETMLMNAFNQPVCLRNISKGMRIDSDFSSAMTKSIPPQATALRIVIQQVKQVIAPPSGITVMDRVVQVDIENNFLITGNSDEIIQQTKFVVTEDTVILNRCGTSITLCSILPGQMVRVTHANFQTMSIPPQTIAYRIQVL